MFALTQEEFEIFIEEALLDLPSKFRELMDNVVITTEDVARPGNVTAIKITQGETLLGLYEGVPRTRRGPNYGMVQPDKITIFKEPIVALGQTPEGIRKLIKETVRHEIGHHFGLSDEAIHRAERRKK
jgi:predicted Zn-dependent protease with MMP-like domain